MQTFRFELKNGAKYTNNDPRMLLLIPELLEENKGKALGYLKNKLVTFDSQNKDVLNVVGTIEEMTSMASDSVAFAYDLSKGIIHSVDKWYRIMNRIKTIN